MHRAHDAEVPGLLGVEDLPGEDHLARLRHAHHARQEVRPTPVGMQAAPDEGLREPRGAGGEADVAGEGQVHPGADGGAVHRGDERLRRVAHLQHRAVARRRHALHERPPATRLVRVLHRLDVATGAKALARAGDDDHAYVRVVDGAREAGRQVFAQRAAERVEAVGPVQRQRGDAILGLVEEALVAHGGRFPFRFDERYYASNLTKETRCLPTS